MIEIVVILQRYVVVWRRWRGNVVVRRRWRVGVEVLLPLIRWLISFFDFRYYVRRF
jgi:hypothetical protein